MKNILNFEIIRTQDGYNLCQSAEKDIDGSYIYQVTDEDDIILSSWLSPTNCMRYPNSHRANLIYLLFEETIEKDKSEQFDRKDLYYDSHDAFSADDMIISNIDDEVDIDTDWNSPVYKSNNTRRGKSFKRYYSTGFLGKLNKSNTLVIHCADNSTNMLAQVYEGKQWDVLRDGNIDPQELHKLIASHSRIICLGHGTGAGLLNIQGGGYVIGYDEAPLLKGKNIFAIWCNATDYFRRNNIGHGCFITKNVPSEVWEAKWVGFTVSAKYMLENITYWSKCCAEVAEQALSGDVVGAVKKARAMYQAKYGNDSNPDQKGVTDYNTDAIQVQP